VLSQPADNIYAFGIAAQTSDDTYDLCIVRPDGGTDCGPGPFPFGPDAGGFRAAGVGCLPAEAGAHSVYWRLRGTQLGAPLPFRSLRPSAQSFCISDPPRPGIDPPRGNTRTSVARVRAAARVRG
jgi:hypothetical protein